MASEAQGYVTQSADTSIEAERLQFQIYAGWSATEKLAVVERLCRDAREPSLAGLRLRHPEASAEELELREAALRLGDELARKVHGQRFAELVGCAQVDDELVGEALTTRVASLRSVVQSMLGAPREG